MRTTPTRSTSLLAMLLAAWAAMPAYAQQAAGAAPAAATDAGIDWPRTFTGQPDFAFTREEIAKEAKERAASTKDASLAQLPTVGQLVADDTKLDPLGLAGLSSATTVSRSTVSSSQPVQSLMDKLLANASALPTFETSYTVDVNEFTTTLNQTIRSTVAGWKPDKSRYSYGALINTLTLQAVVTSPVRYAIINGQRYAEGDTFQLKAPLSVPDTEITEALQKKMPVSGTVPPSAYDQYETAYENAIAAFAAERDKNPEIGRQNLSLPVTVVSIQPRKVTLSVNGEEHELVVKFAY